MKINGYDIDIYLKGLDVLKDGFVLKREDSLKKSKPSIQMKHVKNGVKVLQILNSINEDFNNNFYLAAKNKWKYFMTQDMTLYRGSSKSAMRIFDEADKIAASFDAMGLEKGDHIVACMSNVPEILTLLLAASKRGLVIEFISDKFEKDFIRKIFERTPDRKLFVATDDKYFNVKDLVNEVGFINKVVVSLADSIQVEGNESFGTLDDFYFFSNVVSAIKTLEPDVMSYYDLMFKWLKVNRNFANTNHDVVSNSLNLPLTITYVSDDNGGFKRIVHTNKAYLMFDRFNDFDMIRVPKFHGTRLAYIPPSFDLSVICNSVLDASPVAFEPIYDSDNLLFSMAFNKPAYVSATRSHLIELIKMMELYPEVVDDAFKNVVDVTVVGEGLSKNEEAVINRCMRNVSIGRKLFSKMFDIPAVSVRSRETLGNDAFFTPYKAFQEKFSLNSTVRRDCGLTPLQFVEVAVVDEEARECDFEEYGRLVVKDDSSFDDRYMDGAIFDWRGRIWRDSNLWASVLKNGNVLVKDSYDRAIELSSGLEIPYFMIADKIMELDEVMSCEVVKPVDMEDSLVLHIEFDPKETDSYDWWTEVLLQVIEEKCQDSFTSEIADNIVYTVRDEDRPYPLTIDGKRDILALEREGIKYACKPNILDYSTEAISAIEYFSSQKYNSSQKVKKS